MRPPGRSSAVDVTAAVLLVLGAIFVLAGARLAWLGGSWYYLPAGLVIVAVAWLLVRHHTLAVPLYAGVLAATLAWSVWEVRLDFWQLVPRVAVWFAIGLWLLTPWMRRPPIEANAGMPPRRAVAWLLPLVLVAAAVVGLAASLTRLHDHPGVLPLADAAAATADNPPPDWTSYGATPAGTRYSPLRQITSANVDRLQVAWTYETGDRPGPDDPQETTDENTSLKIGDLLVLCTPHSRVIALDATTGRERWRFDPRLESPVGFKHFEHMTCRGVSYHADAAPAASPAPCRQRVFLPTADTRLIALDLATGSPCEGFGQHGTVDLRVGVGPFEPGGYYSTSPPAIARDLVIVGGHVSDNVSIDEPSGVIRAFDVHDGHLVWNWDPGNPNDTRPLPPGKLYTRSSPNMWSVPSVDEALGLLYLPMGNQTPDQWGALRTAASERFSAGVVALDIATGQVRWVHQFVHHDLWDMDVGGQPSLVDLDLPQGRIPALVASTKQGSIHVLDRRNGEAIVPVKELPAPQGAAQGDRTSPTQPVSDLNFNPAELTEADMWGAQPFDQLWCRIRFRSLRYDGMYTPPSTRGSLVYPGNFGVMDWGAVSVDPVNQVMIGNPSYMAFISRLIPKSEGAGGAEKRGSETSGIKHTKGIPFDIELRPFLSPLGIPCQAPPWGYVAGVDLRTGRIAWQHKNGTIRDSSPVPLPFPLGVPSLGGTIVTAGGVAFLTGTLDYYVRAYDVRDGRTLWQSRLPAGGQATPMTYADARGRQLVVVTAGGHGSLGTKAGDFVIAYALP